MIAWFAPVLLFALGAEQSCAFGAVEAQALARAEILPLTVTQPCKIRNLSHTVGRHFVDVRDAESAMLLDAEGLNLERVRIQTLSSRAVSEARLALIGSGLDDQNLAKICGQHNLANAVVILKGGARAWRAQFPQPGPVDDIDATEALQSIKQGYAQLLLIAPNLSERKMFTDLSPLFAAKVSQRLLATHAKKPVLVHSNHPIAPLPHNWFLVRGGALALANALEFSRLTNSQSDALKRPCFYP